MVEALSRFPRHGGLRPRDGEPPQQDGAATQRDGELTITRERVCAEVSAEHSWDAAAQRLGVKPGLAFMVASGVPADGSGVPELDGRLGGGPVLTSPQALVNPRGHNPLRNQLIEGWVRRRAARELNDG